MTRRSQYPTTLRRVREPLVALVLFLALIALVAPRPPHLSNRTTGDDALAERMRDVADERRVGLAAALVTPQGTATAGLGDLGKRSADRRSDDGTGDSTGSDATGDDRTGSSGTGRGMGDDSRAVTATTPFEIGSITKGLTGMLLADLAADDVVAPEQTLTSILDVPFAPGGVGEATLAQLASHRSGLPRLPVGPGMLIGAAAGTVLGTNSYAWAAEDDDQLLEVAANTEAARPTGEFGYSNLGGALLGHTLAAAAGTPYPQLLRERILTPLGMDDTTVLSAGDDPPTGHATPHRPNGRRVDAWRSVDYAPAGVGVWSTAEDLGRLMHSLLDGSAPGAAAVEPRFDLEEGQVGFGWFRNRYGDSTITWHDGGTGGFRSFIAMDTEAERGVVVLSNSSRDTADIALSLLDIEEDPGDPWWQGRTVWASLAVLLIGAAMAGRLVHRTIRSGTPAGDRIDLATTLAEPLSLLVIAGAIGPWHQVSTHVWWAVAAVAGWATWLGAQHWASVDRLRPRSLIGWGLTGVGLSLNTLVLVAYVWFTLTR